MALLLTASESKSVSYTHYQTDTCEPGGMLNSNYQTIVKLAHTTASSGSIFKIKQRVKSNGFYLNSSAGVILRLLLFTVVILSLFN